MKKEDVAGFIVYLIILGMAIVFGITVLQKYAPTSGLSTVEYVFFVLGAIVVGVIANANLLELGHICGAKVGGYKIVYVNILGLKFYKKDGKKAIKFTSFDGLTGETKILPNPKEGKKSNPVPYLLFGSLFFLIFFIVLLVLFLVFKGTPGVMANVGYFLLIVLAVGFMILIYNVIPCKLDSMTDGYRLTLLTNPKNKEAFNELLRVQYAIENGEKDVEVKTFTEITNFTAELNLNKVYLLFEAGKYEEAEKLIDIILSGKDGVSQRTYIRAKAQKIYIEIMTKPLEEAKEFYDKEVSPDERREISLDVSMSCIRAYMLMSGLLDKSRSETVLALNKVLKAYKKTNKERQAIEIKLYNEALNKVIEAHPKWDLSGYLLTENN